MRRADFQALRMRLLREWKITDNRIIKFTVLLALAVMACISLIAGAKNAFNYSQDFQWDAAKALMLNIDPYELSQRSNEDVTQCPELADFYSLFTQKGLKQKMEANQFPSLLMLLFPFTLVSPMSARVAWLVFNLLCTAGSVILLRKTFLTEMTGFEFASLSLLMIAGTPYRNQLGVGQHTLFSFFFFMLAVYFDQKEVKGQSVYITLSLFVSYFKYTLTAPLALYMIYKKRYREVFVSVLMHVIATVFFAIRLNRSVFYLLSEPLKVAMNLSAEGGLDIGALVGGGSLSLIIGAVVGVFLLLLSIKMPKDCDYLLMPVLVLWSLIITYHRTYDFFVLSLVSMFLCRTFYEQIGEKSYRLWLAAYLLLIILVYFVLRLFGENDFSRMAVGTVYYLFTVALSVLAVKKCRAERIKVNE